MLWLKSRLQTIFLQTWGQNNSNMITEIAQKGFQDQILVGLEDVNVGKVDVICAFWGACWGPLRDHRKCLLKAKVLWKPWSWKVGFCVCRNTIKTLLSHLQWLATYCTPASEFRKLPTPSSKSGAWQSCGKFCSCSSQFDLRLKILVGKLRAPHPWCHCQHTNWQISKQV